VLRASGLQQGTPTGPAPKAAASGGGSFAVSVPAVERNAGGANGELSGRVTFVDNAVDTATGTIRVKGEVPNASHHLWPGQYVAVRMTLRTIPDAIVIPQSALIIRGNERTVYVVKADSTVEPRQVQPRYNDDESVVVEGLRAGEKVVVEGKQNLRPGSAVRETPYAPSRRAPGAQRPGVPAGGAPAGASL